MVLFFTVELYRYLCAELSQFLSQFVPQEAACRSMACDTEHLCVIQYDTIIFILKTDIHSFYFWIHVQVVKAFELER